MQRFRARLEPVPHGGMFVVVPAKSAEAAGLVYGARVRADLAKALASNAAAREEWKKMSPSHKREHVKHVMEAKKPETRARRIAKTIETLRNGPPPHRTWTPKA